MADLTGTAGLPGEYAQLYAALQERMKRGGDLSPGPTDTASRFRQGGRWDPARGAMHDEIIDAFKAKYADHPRGGRAVLMTAGAPGAGKGSTQDNLALWQSEASELGRQLSSIHGLDIKDYVVLNPDDFKEDLFKAGGLPPLSPEDLRLPFGRELTPAEMSGLLHTEASVLRDRCEAWARKEGYNLLYDATLANEPNAAALLQSLSDDKYAQRVILSVEVPHDLSVAQNAGRWHQGRVEFEQGTNAYGGRMSPEGMIDSLYGKATTGRGHSISRENSQQLTERGLATGLITADRGVFTPTTAQAQGATFQRGETTLGIAAAGRLRSAQGTATRTTPVAQTPAPRLPGQTPPAPGRTR
ncbi:zeta toxin family protein [Streptomyces sp. NBC_00249]|uniref:zeta toxin family protein n=1 Tax=Streptomyces sp. NBC_00249 TaxID=2975690 RepID=UPI002252E49E|nr:zeta toxin family protein [Streptomyces sp. NBC_00249]MCX5195013.1 zeta toxin family protein [Streptomyces sp. NBC_00249]